MFKLLLPVAKASFFDISDIVTSSKAYVGEFLSDFKPLLALIIGLLLGIIIISVIINALRG
jgi:hypothetical protein